MSVYHDLCKAAKPYRGRVRIDRVYDNRPGDYVRYNATGIRTDGTTFHMFICGDSTADSASIVANFRSKMKSWE